MKCALSNIALSAFNHADELIAVAEMGVEGIEVATSRLSDVSTYGTDFPCLAKRYLLHREMVQGETIRTGHQNQQLQKNTSYDKKDSLYSRPCFHAWTTNPAAPRTWPKLFDLTNDPEKQNNIYQPNHPMIAQFNEHITARR